MLRALSAAAPLALADPQAALAEASAPEVLTADIPAQPLAQALSAFAHQSGLQLIYVSGLVRDRNSHAVGAGLGFDAGLTLLLQGTELRFEYLTPRSVRILATPSLQPATGPTRADEPYEVIITAHVREETFQNLPVTMQALTGEQLNQLGVRSFNDLMRYTPNVTFSGNGPGTGNIFIRGMGFSGVGNQSQATIAPFPSVALYLDNQSMQFPSRNNDVYLADMARVEVLEGPQGTLLGGGAEAGAVRFITNRPKLDGAVSGEATAAYGITAGGDPNTAASAVLNVPLGSEVALRAVIFSEHRGGYIDNVSATIGFPPGTPPYEFGGNPSANNNQLVGANTNPVDYQGGRLSALWAISDSWDLLLQQNYQQMDADGYFYAYPNAPDGTALGRYQITAFNPAYTKDRYSSTAWTLTGKVADVVHLLYTGSYLDRHIEAQQDYSNYTRGTVGSLYACIGTGASYFNPNTFPGSFPGLSGQPMQCYPPLGFWHDSVRNAHQTEELRISSDDSYRLRGLFGAFWEKYVVYDDMNFNYLGIPQCDPAALAAAAAGGPSCLAAVGPVPGSYASDPTLRENSDTAFGEDLQRGYKQTALFASVDFDIVPRVLTLTGGTRYHKYEEFENGSEFYSETSSPFIVNHPNGACTAAGGCGFPFNFAKNESGFSSHASLGWHIRPDILTYYTFAQGYRPGGFNRTDTIPGTLTPLVGRVAPYCADPSPDPRCQPGGSLYHSFQAVHPASYASDQLINNELGLKSELLNHRVLLNASVYFMRLKDAQSLVFDPAHLGSAVWVDNGPNYNIRGVEVQLVARLTDELTFHGGSAWNSTSQASSPCLKSAGITPITQNNPTPAGACITQVAGLPYAGPWSNTTLPFAPAVMFNARLRYDWHAPLKPFVLLSVSHTASMTNVPANFPDGNGPGQNPPTTALLRYTIPAYTTYDAALGIGKDNWTMQVTATNLTDAYAATNVTAGQFIRSTVPVRPRVVMGQLSFTF